MREICQYQRRPERKFRKKNGCRSPKAASAYLRFLEGFFPGKLRDNRDLVGPGPYAADGPKTSIGPGAHYLLGMRLTVIGIVRWRGSGVRFGMLQDGSITAPSSTGRSIYHEQTDFPPHFKTQLHRWHIRRKSSISRTFLVIVWISAFPNAGHAARTWENPENINIWLNYQCISHPEHSFDLLRIPISFLCMLYDSRLSPSYISLFLKIYLKFPLIPDTNWILVLDTN